MDYIKRVAGAKAVGIGGDYDGVTRYQEERQGDEGRLERSPACSGTNVSPKTREWHHCLKIVGSCQERYSQFSGGLEGPCPYGT